MEKITDKEIRAYLGHNGRECRVRIQKDGAVLRNGSADHFDRSQDGWLYVGTRSQFVADITAERTFDDCYLVAHADGRIQVAA